jgi:DNA-binding transcriptional LysR family regulator
MAISIKSLGCFRAVIDSGSVTGAARKLAVTQPAVSRLLSQLESDIGFELFVRSKGRLIPTDAAVALAKEVDVALQSVERVTQLAVNLRNHDYGELSIVSPPSFAERVVTRLIAGFVHEFPNTRVSLDSRSMPTAQDLIALRAVDCGFARLPLEHPDLEFETWVSSGTVCVLRADHPLTRRKNISATQLKGEPLILLGRGRASRDVLDDSFAAAKVRPLVRIETHTVSAACALVRQNAGIAIVNETLAAQYADKSIVMRRYSPDIRHEYAFVVSANVPMTRITEQFRIFCREFFAANPDPATWSKG